MSEDCLLVAHGKGHCQEQAPEAPKSPQGHAVARLPRTSVWANLPALAVTCPPALSPPAWVRLKLQPSSLANSLSMSMTTRARSKSLRQYLPPIGDPERRGHLPKTGREVKRLQEYPSSNACSPLTSYVVSGKSPDLSEPGFIRWKLFLYIAQRVVLKI